MGSLIIKDLMIMKKQCMLMLFLIIMYAALAMFIGDGGLVMGLLMIYTAILPISTIGYDERSG